MRGKHLELVRLLMKRTDWTTAKQVAQQLQVSERSVKNYIGEINYQEENLIAASKLGYRINRQQAEQVLEKQQTQIPETSEERVNYIITELLSGEGVSECGVDLYDISEKIFVSYETLRKDMVKVRKKVKEYGLFANVTNSVVKLEGKELNKRRLLSMILYEEFNQNLVSLDLVQKAFPEYNMEQLAGIISEECKKSHYYLNEYAMLNLVLDVSISMERIHQNCTFRTHVAEKREFGEQETRLVEGIAKRIEDEFGIRIDGLELEELKALILSHLMKVDVSALNRENLPSVIPPRSMEIVERVLEYLNENYYIDTSDENFMVKFAVHMHNLLLRMDNAYTAKNPLTDHIKNTCPLIFECAVGVANCLNQMTGYRIDEDEIAYIAIHIGGNLENYSLNKEKTDCVIVCPQYYDLSVVMAEKIAAEFSGKLTIKAVLTKVSDLKIAKQAELVISTVVVKPEYAAHMVLVSPFLRTGDLEQIRKEISDIQKERKRNKLREALLQITSKEMFYINAPCSDREACLKFMIRDMEENGYVEPSFLEEVYEREHHSPTVFGRLAVPHAMKLNARKTGMYIMISEKGIIWGKQTVNLVLLFAVNKEDRAMFHEVFDNFIVLLLENQNLDLVLESRNYEAFVDAIMSCE